MRELFDVKFNQDGSFDLGLANGIIRVPEYSSCYVLSTGCGTGKTECCKSIIRQRYQEGILYCVDTIEELDKMYSWIMTEHFSIGINPDDVIVISSDARHQTFLWEYQNNPELLMHKKIVLITHARFWTDLINYFLIYDPQYRVDPFDGDFQNLMSRPDLRKFVIFDETPKFIQPFFSMPKCMLAAFSEQDMNGYWQCSTPQVIREKYYQYFKDSDQNPFPNDATRIGRIKRNVVFNLIPKYYSCWSNLKCGEVEMTFTPIHLVQDIVNTRILILEGAGDILFQQLRYYAVLDLKDKYNSTINFESFPFELKRRGGLEPRAYDRFITSLASRIASNQLASVKTLVVVWKNQGEESRNSKDSKFFEDVREKLSQTSGLDTSMYDVIYYGASECKSTNQYRDYTEIILAGDWNMTNHETERFNSHFGVTINTESHKLWFFIQLLCRIGIRSHDWKRYSVLYSSDFSTKFMQKLQQYLSGTLSFSNQIEVKKSSLLMDYLLRTRVRSNYRDEIFSLCQYDPWIKEHILSQQQYKFSITLDEIAQLIPKDKKKRSKYNNLVKVMATFGITMSIN